ncbi:MAG TPA: GFA family protein [Polyangiaceae bacterium]|nr:GFA family protein [Polyangiaceae bacterium]
MSEQKTYRGSCHCGRVRFEVTAEISRASACNCSICSRTGWLMTSVPAAQFKLVAGADAQTDYQFGKRTMHHLFCRTCGIRAFGKYVADDQESIIVNLRCLEGLDVGALEVETFDGKSYA